MLVVHLRSYCDYVHCQWPSQRKCRASTIREVASCEVCICFYAHLYIWCPCVLEDCGKWKLATRTAHSICCGRVDSTCSNFCLWHWVTFHSAGYWMSNALSVIPWTGPALSSKWFPSSLWCKQDQTGLSSSSDFCPSAAMPYPLCLRMWLWNVTPFNWRQSTINLNAHCCSFLSSF